MASISISDRVDFALENLKGQLQSEINVSGIEVASHDILDPVNSLIETFQEEFILLTMFADCLDKWSDADQIDPNLKSLATRIEGATQEFARQLESIPNVISKPKINASILRFLYPSMRKKAEVQRLQKWASDVVAVFEHTNNMIELLKQEIGRVYESRSLPIHSLQWQFPASPPDFLGWKKLVQSLKSSRSLLPALREQIGAFVFQLERITNILDYVTLRFNWNPEDEEMVIQISSVSVRAALLFSEYWVSPRKSNMHDMMKNSLANLQQDIHPINSQFVDMYLVLLKTWHPVFVGQLRTFLDCFLTYKNLYDRHQDLITEFITSVINTIWEYIDSEDGKRFLGDVKEFILELEYAQNNSKLTGYDRSELKLFEKIWHIKIDIFLWMQLAQDKIFYLPLQDQITGLSKGVTDLKTYFNNPPPAWIIKNGGEIFTLVQEVADEIASLLHPSYAQEITIKRVRNVQFKLLLMIVCFGAKSFYVDLSNISQSLRNSVQDNIESATEDLKFLSTLFLTNGSEVLVQHGKLIFRSSQAMARSLISLCHLSRANKITEVVVKKMNFLLSRLIEENKIFMVKLKEKYLRVSNSKFPKTDRLGFIDSFLRHKRCLLNDNAELFAPLKHHIQFFLADLKLLRQLLGEILAHDIEVQELKHLVSCVVDVAYKAEYLIDLIVLENVVDWHRSLCLYLLVKDIALVRKQVTRIYEKKSSDARAQDDTQTSRHITPNSTTRRIDDFVVDLIDEEEVIIDLLTGGFSKREIVTIVGMPGIGKTTLAKQVYNTPEVEYHFHIRAWCCVSNIFQKRELLLEILSHITADNIQEMSEEDLELKLYQILKQKRYLIVMDDMWNSEAWDNLEKSFPDDEQGSRILITSRLHDVLHGEAHTYVHALRPLSDDESWDLLQKMIFHEEGCPEELMEVGRKIARNCKGLPLSVVAIAGLLERMDQRQEHWIQISETLSSRILDDQETRCMGILEMSYEHLPEKLKACFLYFGAFLEDKDIPVPKLIRLWIAEGFLEDIAEGFVEDKLNIENVAENYLMDLIGRSLVIVAQWRSNGRIKACRIHDMIRNLCLSKAKEEDFFQLITGCDEDPDSLDGLDYGSDYDSDSDDTSNLIIYEDYRLFIHSTRKQFVMPMPSGPRVRSLLLFPRSDAYPRCPYDISFICANFKLLRVLDVECINMGPSFLDGFHLLVHLRYFAAGGDIDHVPSSISCLFNLETFIIQGLKGKVKLPNTIWCMPRLRHVHVSDSAVFSWLDDDLENLYQLHGLVSLSSPILSYGKSSEKILRLLPNLQKLKCKVVESRRNSEKFDLFPRFDVLNQLELLKISYHAKARYSGELVLPLNLKKLTLTNFRLPWDHISAIGRLPNLEVLKLLSRAFEGESWDMVEGDFSKLRFLKLDTLNIAKWNAFTDHLPNLEHLVLRCCKYLEEVPFSFGEIPTLKTIEVRWCSVSAEDSVRQIREEAMEGLKVFILSDSDFKSQP